METEQIINEIKRLPVKKRMLVVEKTIKSIRESELEKKMTTAVDALIQDYKNDRELTAFTAIDSDDFHETRWYMAD